MPPSTIVEAFSLSHVQILDGATAFADVTTGSTAYVLWERALNRLRPVITPIRQLLLAQMLLERPQLWLMTYLESATPLQLDLILD